MKRPPPPSESPDDGPAPPRPGAIDDAKTGLPGFRSWRSVYLFVFISFLVWVGLLAALTRIFS